MAYLLSSERPALAAATFNPLRALGAWFAKARARRAQRLALAQLLDYEPALLDDLGVNRQDLFEAMHHPSHRPGPLLSARRADKARNWLSP